MSKIIFLLFFLSIVACQSPSPRADLVIQNANIYTVDDAQPTAEVIAVIGDTIAFVGTQADAQAWIGENTSVLDLEGNTVTPGLIEGHAHFMGIGINQLELDLMATQSFEEIIAQVQAAAQQAKPGDWITGRGWHQDKWDSLPKLVQGFPVHDALSAASPNNPVYLKHASGHMALANAQAMETAGVMNIDQEGMQAQEVAGGEVIRDPLDNPTGLFNENAMALITQHIPDRTPESNRRAAELAMEEC